MTSLEMADLICSIIDDKKGKDIVKIQVDKISSLCDYFIIASGNSTTNVKAIAEEVEEKLSKQEINVKRMEGLSEGRWVAMDYGDIIVHIFNDETRLFYHLEKLWEEGKASDFKPVEKTEKAKKAAAPNKEKAVKKPAKEKEPAAEKKAAKKPAVKKEIKADK